MYMLCGSHLSKCCIRDVNGSECFQSCQPEGHRTTDLYLFYITQPYPSMIKSTYIFLMDHCMCMALQFMAVWHNYGIDQKGDKIYLFGSSQGAGIAWTLVEMVHKVLNLTSCNVWILNQLFLAKFHLDWYAPPWTTWPIWSSIWEIPKGRWFAWCVMFY